LAREVFVPQTSASKIDLELSDFLYHPSRVQSQEAKERLGELLVAWAEIARVLAAPADRPECDAWFIGTRGPLQENIHEVSLPSSGAASDRPNAPPPRVGQPSRNLGSSLSLMELLYALETDSSVWGLHLAAPRFAESIAARNQACRWRRQADDWCRPYWLCL
jgi:hypothetical protein